MAAEGFEAFYRREFKRRAGLLMLHGFPRQTAMDATQSAMIDAAESWHRIDHPAAWVRKVAFSYACRESADEAARSAWEYRSFIKDPPAAEPDPAVLAELGAEHRSVMRTLLDLPPKRRAVVALLYEGYSTAEIARILEINPATVRSHARHARQALGGVPELGGGR